MPGEAGIYVKHKLDKFCYKIKYVMAETHYKYLLNSLENVEMSNMIEFWANQELRWMGHNILVSGSCIEFCVKLFFRESTLKWIMFMISPLAKTNKANRCCNTAHFYYRCSPPILSPSHITKKIKIWFILILIKYIQCIRKLWLKKKKILNLFNFIFTTYTAGSGTDIENSYVWNCFPQTNIFEKWIVL